MKDCNIPYKKIYWRGINISDWRFFRKFTNIKYANINKKGERQMDIQTERDRVRDRQKQVRGRKGGRETETCRDRDRKRRERERGKNMQIKRQKNEKIIFFKM